MKKKLFALFLALVMVLSLGTVAFSDNGKSSKDTKESKDAKANAIKKLQVEISVAQKKITATENELKLFTAKSDALKKKIADLQTKPVTVDFRTKLIDSQKVALEAWYKESLAVTGVTEDQKSKITELYEAEKKALEAKLAKFNSVIKSESNPKGLESELAAFTKKIDAINKALTELKAKLAKLKADLAKLQPTATPAPTTTPTPAPSTTPTPTPGT